jgi:murein DD-endopeptidase MepM/ murein hydrolase activator NlpD
MEDDKIKKLEISGFVNTPIKPEARGQRTIEVNARPGWYTRAVKKTMDRAKAVKSSISFVKKEKGEKDANKTYKDLLIKTGICAAIALTLLLVRNINSPFTNQITSEIKTAINTETDMEKEIGRLKFVENIFGSEPVLSEITGENDIYPVEGKVVKKFGEDDSKGVSIETALSAPVVASASGSVTKIGKTKDGIPFLKIAVDDKTQMVYTGVIARVKEKAKVKRGEILGTLKGNTLTWEVDKDGAAVDPLDYISAMGIKKEE